MALPNPPELRRLADFMASLPHCPHGCPNGWVYPSPTFSVHGAVDAQVTGIIAQYEREGDGMLRQHLAEELTATLPADLRATGVRFEWAEQQ